MKVMFHENEDKVMVAPGVCFGGSSCRQTFAPSVRVKKPGSHVRHLCWLHVQLLVVLLAGRASCNGTAAPSPLSATTNAQTSVHYTVDVSVNVNRGTKNESEIKAWFIQVFQNNLDSCGSQTSAETSAPPTSPQTETTLVTTATTLQNYNTTTVATSTPFKNTNATTAVTSTTSESLNTTTAVTSTTSESLNTTTAVTSTTSESLNTTTAVTSTTSESLNTTTDTSTTAESLNTTTDTSTTSESLSTTTATSTTSESLSTTTATSTTSESLSTTTATSTTAESLSTTTATSTTSESLSTTTATSTTAESLSTTTATSTTSESLSTTTATSTTAESLSTTTATSTTSESLSTTTATSTTSESLSTTTAATESSTTSSPISNNGGGNPKPSNSPNSNSNSNNQRVAREILDPVAETSGVAGDKTTGLFQNLEVSCTANTNATEIICLLTLELKQSVSPCCILRKLCEASQTSSDITVVGKRADKINQLQNNCSSSQQEQSSCIYTGQGAALCNNSETAYQVPQLSSANCSADKQNNCNCSSSCSGPDAFYTFQISMKDPEIEISSIGSLLSKLKHPPNCPPDVLCPLTILASEFKDLRLTCNNTGAIPQSCRVILDFAHEVPICNVSMAVMTVLQAETKISYDGLVTRAAICGDSVSSSLFSNQQFTWVEVAKNPAIFCETLEESNLQCQNGENVVVLLDEQCTQNLFTTPGPNVTTIQPNTNLTQNATTAAVNVTVTVTLNTTSTNESISVTPSESPNSTESADSQANALLELTRNVSQMNSSQVAQLVSQLENLLSGPTVSLALGNTSVHIVSNLLGASPETLSGSSNRIIGIVDTVALKLVLEQQPETLLSPAVALSVKPADGSNFQETFFSISDPTDVQVRGDPRQRRSARRDSSIPQGSIRLPPSLTQDLTSDEQHMASRVQFNFYQKSTVFQDKSLGKRKLNSGILGASVANLSIAGLQQDVVIHLKNIEPVPDNFVASCVFWDFTLNNGSGGWSSSGCYVQNSTNNETICSCNHLTSFAILLDLAREPLTSRLQDTILTFITYIGCGISSIFLSITLLTYLAFGKLRKDIPSKILIQLCLALLLLNMVFLVDAWLALYPNTVGLCISTAWFLHYFLLVAFTWMGLEAIHMYLALVKVFNSYISRYMLKFSLVGWGVPMIVVIIVIAIDKNNYGLVSYGKFPDGTTDDFCWLKNDIAFYVAVVAYFCVIFLFNFVMFIVVLVQLQRLKKQNPHNALHRSTLQDARSVAGITMLLGLTWGFAFFAWGPVNLAFMYLFAIFNSFQGLFIFVFHCALKENVRRQWRTYLCCGRMRLAENSEWSRTATQKTVKKSSVTRLTSLHSSKSSKSNNSSSSSSFLVSDSSEQINGIGNPIEDRAITADEEPGMDVILNEINSQYRNQQAP